LRADRTPVRESLIIVPDPDPPTSISWIEIMEHPMFQMLIMMSVRTPSLRVDTLSSKGMASRVWNRGCHTRVYFRMLSASLILSSPLMMFASDVANENLT
jgi:hypothetical protein